MMKENMGNMEYDAAAVSALVEGWFAATLTPEEEDRLCRIASDYTRGVCSDGLSALDSDLRLVDMLSARREEALAAVEVPSGLEERVRQTVRREAVRERSGMMRRRLRVWSWGAAAACLAAIAFGYFRGYEVDDYIPDSVLTARLDTVASRTDIKDASDDEAEPTAIRMIPASTEKKLAQKERGKRKEQKAPAVSSKPHEDGRTPRQFASVANVRRINYDNARLEITPDVAARVEAPSSIGNGWQERDVEETLGRLLLGIENAFDGSFESRRVLDI